MPDQAMSDQGFVTWREADGKTVTRPVVAMLAELERHSELHSLARQALLRHFTPEQVGDDLAPRVLELLAELERLREELPEVQCPSCGATIRARMSDAPMPDQEVEFDTLILAALDARSGSDGNVRRAAEGGFKIACWMARRGVRITLDGNPFDPKFMSSHRALRLIEQRGLFEEDQRG